MPSITTRIPSEVAAFRQKRGFCSQCFTIILLANRAIHSFDGAMRYNGLALNNFWQGSLILCQSQVLQLSSSDRLNLRYQRRRLRCRGRIWGRCGSWHWCNGRSFTWCGRRRRRISWRWSQTRHWSRAWAWNRGHLLMRRMFATIKICLVQYQLEIKSISS